MVIDVLFLFFFIAKGTSFSAISALANIPATIFGVFVYEIFFVDSDRGEKRVNLEINF